jgi:hypothetical protein
MKSNIKYMFGDFIVVDTSDVDDEGNWVGVLYLQDAPNVNNPETWGYNFDYMVGDPQNWTPGEVVVMDDFYLSNVDNQAVFVFKEDRPRSERSER